MVDAVMSAAAVLVLLLLLLSSLLVLEVEGNDLVAGAGAGGGTGATENKVRSGVRSNSYEQKKRPMYGAVPSSAAARPWYAVRMRDENVLVRLSDTVFAGVVVAAAAGAKTASSPRRSERTAARSVG